TPTGEAITATENTAFTGSVATFGSPDNGPFTAEIHWGDGSSSAGSVSTVSAGNFSVTGTHTYADELTGSAVSVVITDTSDATTATATSTATVSDADVLAPGTPVTATATAGTTFTGTVATFIDAGYPTNSASDFTATVDWGDGTSSTGS